MKSSRLLVTCLCLMAGWTLTESRAETAPPVEPELVAAAEGMVDALGREDFATATARFSPVLRRTLPEARLRSMWLSMTQQAGYFCSRMGSRFETQGASRVVFVSTQFRDFVLEAKISFNAAGEVTGLHFLAPPKGSD